MELYDAFCTAVTAQIPHATRQEKEAIHRELAEHLADHAADLTDAGLSPEDAAAAAVAAMGDPSEIGQAMNQAYPAWPREAALILKGLIAICIVLLVYSIWTGNIFPTANITARYTPDAAFSWPEEAFQSAQAVDYRGTLNGHVFSVYRLDRTVTEGDGPIVRLWICTYNENPFLNQACNALETLWFHSESSPEPLHTFQPGSFSTYGAGYAVYEISVPPEDTMLTISLGTDFIQEIPLPESEVQP